MSNPAIPLIPYSHEFPVADLDVNRPIEVTLKPDPAMNARIAEYLGINGLSKPRLVATLTLQRNGRVDVTGKLGATVTQSCVVSLAPVRTRIEDTVQRRFVTELPDPGDDYQMGEDEETVELLGKTIDLGAILVEDLALALPPFPRADDAQLETRHFTAPGHTPMSDDDAKPFAALAALKGKLKDAE